MCMGDAFDGNKVQVCTVGDLNPGDRYRDPEGREFLVTRQFTTVDLQDGTVDGWEPSTKLGRDKAGRLYASRYLNTTTPVQPSVSDAIGFDNRHED